MKIDEINKFLEAGMKNMFPFEEDDIRAAFEKRLQELDIPGVYVEDVAVGFEGDILVSLSDNDEDELAIVFQYSLDDGVTAMLLDDEDFSDDDPIDSADSVIVDLDALGAPVIDTPFGKYPDLIKLNWINRSTMMAMLKAGDLVDTGADDDEARRLDAYGNLLSDEEGSRHEDFTVELEERSAVVVRGGKKVRLPIVRRVRKKRLSPRQKAGIRKAVIKRKAKKSQIQRSQKKSRRLRKSLGLKNTELRSRERIKR